MQKMVLQLVTGRKQLQKNVASGLRRSMGLLLVSMSLSLLVACSMSSSVTAPAKPAAGATSTATTAATGHLAAVIACSSLAQKDFSTIPDASTKIRSVTTVVATATSLEACKIDGVISPQAKFELQLPTKQWNGNYFEGGCGGYCGRLSEPSECVAAFNTGDAVGYSDLGHESTNNDNSWAFNQALREDFAYHANLSFDQHQARDKQRAY